MQRQDVRIAGKGPRTLGLGPFGTLGPLALTSQQALRQISRGSPGVALAPRSDGQSNKSMFNCTHRSLDPQRAAAGAVIRYAEIQLRMVETEPRRHH
jgi:hypothetical protein